ncbi:MFS transporter [Arthrospiribacter ruber]|uniref:MFS transporter n=1 Tax=Arthrospiribacter ruber TaxID=2487934 RepID=A0A951MFN7_9BACT|nr:MFS transporter [Arthrospiribacter ruber]MBW3468651.1 MFS transporter [Arthrospiribacter ruber]
MQSQKSTPPYILFTIVISQFLCTSLWFAGNAILPELVANFGLAPSYLGHLTSAVQLGFISGTLLFAILTLADRFPPSSLFFLCSVLASVCNFILSLDTLNAITALTSRFGTGFFLAGIYPVGMKIASDYYQKGLGKSLGLLVGALVMGTAFPHFIRSFTAGLEWHYVVYLTSLGSLIGGTCMLLFVPNGPYRSPSKEFDFSLFMTVFKEYNFRKAAFGYFGHMWELYAFWAFLPVFLTAYSDIHGRGFDLSFWSFVIIAVGGISCALGGILSERSSPKAIAQTALFLSGTCCFLSPLMFWQQSPILLLVFLVFWGTVVTADSPMFSTLVAQSAPAQNKGTGLTIVNCIGFGITIFSIQLLNWVQTAVHPMFLLVTLSIGPILGLVHFIKFGKSINKGK